MAEAFSAFADNLVTKDYFSEVLTARLNEQSASLEQRIMGRVDERFAEQDAKFEARFAVLQLPSRALHVPTLWSPAPVAERADFTVNPIQKCPLLSQTEMSPVDQ